jgi:hypothetical protein
VKDGSFRRVREQQICIVVVEDFDLVFTQAPGSAKMEVARVFITKDTSFLSWPFAASKRLYHYFLAHVFFLQEHASEIPNWRDS